MAAVPAGSARGTSSSRKHCSLNIQVVTHGWSALVVVEVQKTQPLIPKFEHLEM
jgi:hypothetical protein